MTIKLQIRIGQYKFDVNVEILIVEKMIVIHFFGKTKQNALLSKTVQDPKGEDRTLLIICL